MEKDLEKKLDSISRQVSHVSTLTSKIQTIISIGIVATAALAAIYGRIVDTQSREQIEYIYNQAVNKSSNYTEIMNSVDVTNKPSEVRIQFVDRDNSSVIATSYALSYDDDGMPKLYETIPSMWE